MTNGPLHFTDAQVLAAAIKSAARWLGVGMILLGLMVWQPWASPKIEDVKWKDNSNSSRSCAVYKDTVDCYRR